MNFQKKIAILLSLIFLFPQISFAESSPAKKGGDLYPFNYIKFPKEGDGGPYSMHKTPMTVEDRINQYTISIAGLMGEDLAAMTSDILLDGEYNMVFLGEDSGTVMYSNFDEGATFNFSSIQEQVYFYLRSVGFSAASAAGIMGNIEQESGFNPALEERKDKPPKGYGLMQWTNPIDKKTKKEIEGRRSNMERFCGAERQNPIKQMEYFWKEEFDKNTYEQYRIGLELAKIGVVDSKGRALQKKEAVKAFQKLTSPTVAAEIFCWGFERPHKPSANIARRRGAAKKYYEKFSNLSVSEEQNKGNLFTRNQKDRKIKKTYDKDVYIRTKKGDLLESDESKLASQASQSVAKAASTPKNPVDGIVVGSGVKTRLELLQRIERMKGAKYDKLSRNTGSLRNEKGYYDPASFVDRTTAFMTGKTTMGQRLEPSTDIYRTDKPGPFKTSGRSWIQSRYNIFKPKNGNPLPHKTYDENGDEINAISVRFVEIKREDLKPGDICFISNKEKNHMAFYMGGGRVFGAMNEALGVNWAPQRGGSALDYYNRFYRTLHLKQMNEEQYEKIKKEQKEVLATKRDAFTGRDGMDSQAVDRPLDDLGNPLYNYKWGDKGDPEDI